MSINENNSYEIAKRLAFPRLVGSEGEKKAIDVIIDEFQKVGYQSIKQEEFKTSFKSWMIARFFCIPLGIFIILTAISFYFNPLITIILTLLTFIYLLKILGITSAIDIPLMKNDEKNHETKNIYVELKSKNSKAKVVFMAHWDSKSQTLPVLIRLLLYILVIFADLIILSLYAILSAINLISLLILNQFLISIPILNDILLYICIIFGIAGALNYFNKTENKSPGAKDNATAVGIIIELARYFKNNPLTNIDLIFLTTGSEELNLGGAKDFIKKHRLDFDPKFSYFINLDAIGGFGVIRLITSYGIPRKTSSKKLNDLFLTSAKELNIEVKSNYVPTGAWGDHQPIVEQNFEACMISSGGGLKEMHTKNDKIELVSKEGLKNGLMLCAEVANKLNTEFS